MSNFQPLGGLLLKIPSNRGFNLNFHSTLPETNIAPEKWMVGILVSFWDGLFLGAICQFQGVYLS